MKNIEIPQIIAGIDTLKDVKLNIKVSFVIIKNLEKLKEAWALLEKTRIQLIEKLALKDDAGKPKTDASKNVYLFANKEDENLINTDMNTLYNEDSDIQFELFNASEIENINDITLKQTEILLLFTNK